MSPEPRQNPAAAPPPRSAARPGDTAADDPCSIHDIGRSARGWSRARRAFLGLAVLSTATLLACGAPEDGLDLDTSLYALVTTAEGVHLYPPLAPEPAFSGAFDATLLDHLSVVLEATDAEGATQTLGTFDAATRPALKLLAEHEMYWVNVPAATYFTDPSLAYRFRVLRDGAEIASSDMSDHVFTVLRYVPQLPIGVKVRIEQPRPRTFRFSACIDGSDWLHIQDNRLWLVHGSFDRPASNRGDCPVAYRGYVYVNGSPWAVTWSGNTSNTYAPSPAPLPASPQTIVVSRSSTRGTVNVTQQPTAANGFEGSILIDDRGPGGAAVYEIDVTYLP